MVVGKEIFSIDFDMRSGPVLLVQFELINKRTWGQ